MRMRLRVRTDLFPVCGRLFDFSDGHESGKALIFQLMRDDIKRARNTGFLKRRQRYVVL